MKKLVSITVIAILILTLILPASALNVQSNFDKALSYYKTNYEANYSLPDDDFNKIKADVWTMYCVSSPENLYDLTNQFMTPEVDPADAADYVTPSEVAKDILALSILNKTVPSSINQTLVDNLVSRQSANGSFLDKTGETNVSDQMWSITALEAARSGGATVNYNKDKAVSALIALQKTDGGFTYWDMELDTTGAALIALSMAGTPAADVAKQKAVTYIENSLDNNANMIGKGKWDSANSCAQAYGIMGLLAAGEDVTGAKWTRGGKTVVDALLAYQTAEGGFLYASFSEAPDSISTTQGMMALVDLKNGKNLWVSMLKTDEPTTTKTEIPTSTTTPKNNDVETGGSLPSPALWVVGIIAIVALIMAFALPAFKKKK